MKNTKTKMFFLGMAYLAFMLFIGVTAVNQSRAYFEELFRIQPPSLQKDKAVFIKDVETQMELLKYNDRVPEELVKREIKSLSERFNLDEALFNRMVKCESGYNNLAKNPNSTALGLAQYLIKTWEETESFKQHRCARTDYKCSLWEMALDLAGGEIWRWDASKQCWK